MPSTHPSGTWLARQRVAASSTLLSGSSLSHSNGVSFTRADQVVPSSERDSLPPRGMASLHGVATKKSQLRWMTFTFPLSSRTLYMGTSHNLMHNYVLYLTPLVLHLPLSLEFVCLHEHDITWHELHGTCSPVIVPFLFFHLTVRFELCFSIGFFEVLLHFFNIGGDLVVNNLSLLTTCFYTHLSSSGRCCSHWAFLLAASFPIILNRVW